MTAAAVAPLLLPAPLPGLRLLPAPSSEPPYDDELPQSPVLRLAARHAPARPAPARAVRPGTTRAPAPADDWSAAQRTRTDELPAPHPFARALVQGLLEVLAGVRPVKQLQRDTSVELYAVLERTLSERSRPLGVRPGARAVRSLHLQQRPEGVVEVCATVERGARAAALALRLEGLDGRWRCTDLAGL